MSLFRAVDRVVQFLIARIIRAVVLQLDLALWLDRVRQWVPHKVRRWTGSLRRLTRRIFVQNPPVPPSVFRKKRRPWNRTPDHIEEQLARLHVEHRRHQRVAEAVTSTDA